MSNSLSRHNFTHDLLINTFHSLHVQFARRGVYIVYIVNNRIGKSFTSFGSSPLKFAWIRREMPRLPERNRGHVDLLIASFLTITGR